MNNTVRISLQSTEGVHRKITVKKEEFHKTLLDVILAGLSLSTTIYGKLEGVLNGIYEGVKQSEESSVNQMYWVLLTVYKYDAIQRRVFACKL
jgi:hypothetical protein